jgi:hypothetical protein
MPFSCFSVHFRGSQFNALLNSKDHADAAMVYSRQSSPIGTGVAKLVEWSSQAASLISPRTEATEP